MITQRIIDLIKSHEGCRLTIYEDSRGFPTIGYGHKILPGEDFSAGMTQQEADVLLASDLSDLEESAMDAVAQYMALNEVRQGVVLDMLFNLGLAGFSAFKRLIAALNASDFVTAANEMTNSAWYSQVKSRAIDDVNLMRRGVWI